MATQIQRGSQSAKAAVIRANYAEKTDLNHELSYGNGVQNIVNVKNTGLTMRTRITNTTDDVQTVYIIPTIVIAGSIKDKTTNDAVLTKMGLPAGTAFFLGEYVPDPAGAPTKKLTMVSMNRDQDLSMLANEAYASPFQIIGMHQKSYVASTGAPDDSNNSGTITKHNVSAWRANRYEDINLGQFQKSTQFANDIVKVDFIAEKFVIPISINDVLSFDVNPDTKIDLTFQIGARASKSERFYRQITAGNELLVSEFPREFSADDSCGCGH